MKPKEINDLVDSVLAEEVRNAILNGKKSEVFHIKCGGEPIDTFENEQMAQENLQNYKKSHPDKEFIIEKCVYESHSDMIDKLDEMSQQIEQNESSNMKKSPVKVKTIHEAILHASKNGFKTVRINEEVYDVEECLREMDGEDECDECEDSDMSEEDTQEGLKDLFKKKKKEPTNQKYEYVKDDNGENQYPKKVEPKKGVDLGKSFDKMKKDMKEDEICETCKKEPCECSVNESKPKSIRITEAQLVSVISNIVKESEGVPGIAVTKKAQNGSKKINDDNAKDVGKKLKDYLNFNGNDNPEFPKPIGKGEKVAINNTEEEEEFVDDNRGRGMENLVYDHEPSAKFKERAKASLEGDSKMGNSAETEDKKVETSNGAKPEKAKEKTGDTIKTDTGKNINKTIPRKEKIKKDEPRYPKEKVQVKEERIKFSSLLAEELTKMSRSGKKDK